MPHSGKLINHCVKRSGAAALVHQMAQTNLEWTLMSDCGLAASIWTTASHNFVSNKLDCHLRQWWARMLLGIAWDAAEGAAMQPWFDLIWFDNLTGLTRFDLIWFDLIWCSIDRMFWLLIDSSIQECTHCRWNFAPQLTMVLAPWRWSWRTPNQKGPALTFVLWCVGCTWHIGDLYYNRDERISASWLLRLHLKMQDRDLTGLEKCILYAAGFPCQPSLVCKLDETIFYSKVK